MRSHIVRWVTRLGAGGSVVALTVTGGALAWAAPALAGQPVEDRIISSVDGYQVVPESEVVGQGSGPLSGDDLASAAGVDPDELPEGLDGYMRMFAELDGGSVALVVALSLDGVEADEFLAGYEESAEAQGSGPVDLLPGQSGELGDLVAYEIEIAGQSVATTAFVADDLAVMVQVTGADDQLGTLRTMVRAQASLTPPTVARGSSELGEIGFLNWMGGPFVWKLLLIVIVGGPALLITRARQRARHVPVPPPPSAAWGPLASGVPAPPRSSAWGPAGGGVPALPPSTWSDPTSRAPAPAPASPFDPVGGAEPVPAPAPAPADPTPSAPPADTGGWDLPR